MLDKAKSDLDSHNALTKETVDELKTVFKESQSFLTQKGFSFVHHGSGLSGLLSSDDGDLRISIRVHAMISLLSCRIAMMKHISAISIA